jgi:hypothetical protein
MYVAANKSLFNGARAGRELGDLFYFFAYFLGTLALSHSGSQQRDDGPLL